MMAAAIVAGPAVPHGAWFLVAIGGTVVAALMFVLWLVQVVTRNAGYVDVGWAWGLGILAGIYAWLGPATGMPKWVLAAMVGCWALRLGTHLLVRTVGQPEEGRYQQLRSQWPTATNLKFLLFFWAQALLDCLLAVPFLLVAMEQAPAQQASALGAAQIIGIALWLLAVAGESIADAQLARFKRTAQHGSVCRAGLWNYSRHPNYFFEWLVWLAWAIFASTCSHGWLAFGSPVLMLFFLYRVTGIPATEAQAVRSKGDAYREYQRHVSAFVPWFPREGKQ
jgi:steroid 5-alpha reductase family enzyme